MAAQVGIAQETLSRFELGKLREFGWRKLLAVLAVWGMKLQFGELGAAGSLDELRRERAGNPCASQSAGRVSPLTRVNLSVPPRVVP